MLGESMRKFKILKLSILTAVFGCERLAPAEQSQAYSCEYSSGGEVMIKATSSMAGALHNRFDKNTKI